MTKDTERRYQIARQLNSIISICTLASDEQVEAIFDAIDLISPEFAADQAAEIDAALNDPEFMREVEAVFGKTTPEEAAAKIAEWEAERQRRKASEQAC